MRFRVGSFLVALGMTFALPAALAQGGTGIFVTPIPGQPFMGIVDVERQQILPNGKIVSLKTMHAIARDSQGRIYNEMRLLIPAASNVTPPIISIHIYDPQIRINTFLTPQQHLARQEVVNVPPATQPPGIDASPADGNPLYKVEDLGTRTMDGVSVRGVRKTQTILAASGGKMS